MLEYLIHTTPFTSFTYRLLTRKLKDRYMMPKKKKKNSEMAHADDTLNIFERGLELLSIIGLGLVLSFLLYIQTTDTGFFTDEFGFIEQIALYIPLLLAIVPASLRFANASRNSTRPLDAIVVLLQGLGAVWLLIVFPFDYTHLVNSVPAILEGSVEWISNDIGRGALVFEIMISPFIAIGHIVRYIMFPRVNVPLPFETQ